MECLLREKRFLHAASNTLNVLVSSEVDVKYTDSDYDIG